MNIEIIDLAVNVGVFIMSLMGLLNKSDSHTDNTRVKFLIALILLSLFNIIRMFYVYKG